MGPNQRVLGSGLPSGVPLPRLDRVRNEGHGGTVPVDAPAVHSLGLSAAGRTGLGPVAIGLGRCGRPGIDQNVHTDIVLPGIRFCGAKGRVLRPDGSLGVQQRRPHLWREDAAGPVRHHLLSQGIVGGDLSGANQIRRSAHPRDRSLLRSVHIGGYIGAFFLLRFLLGFAVDFIEQHVVLEAEALAILFSCLVNIWNVPPLLYQLMLMMYPVQVIYPYGSIYLSASSREFWSKWSRPASSLIRHMFYYPLGGSGRAWLSIPLMFLLNASSHFSVSEALVGDKAEVGWLMVFGILGLVATLEVFGNQCFEKIDPENNRTVAPKWWSAIRFLAAVVALRFAAFVLLHECLSSSLSDLVLQTNNS